MLRLIPRLFKGKTLNYILRASAFLIVQIFEWFFWNMQWKHVSYIYIQENL